MREFSIEENLKKTMNRLSKRDKSTFDSLSEKMDEIVTCEDVDHYKNLRKPLQHLKRVHIGNSVLVFRYVKSEDKVIFVDFDHHDSIYQK